MFTVHPEEFESREDVSMAEQVLKASIVNMASSDVEEYAEIMDLELIRE